ncbi:MAG: hypothetical protein Q9218_000239 [Villophora microphyllina]
MDGHHADHEQDIFNGNPLALDAPSDGKPHDLGYKPGVRPDTGSQATMSPVLLPSSPDIIAAKDPLADKTFGPLLPSLPRFSQLSQPQQQDTTSTSPCSWPLANLPYQVFGPYSLPPQQQQHYTDPVHPVVVPRSFTPSRSSGLYSQQQQWTEPATPTARFFSSPRSTDAPSPSPARTVQKTNLPLLFPQPQRYKFPHVHSAALSRNAARMTHRQSLLTGAGAIASINEGQVAENDGGEAVDADADTDEDELSRQI